MGTFIRNQRYKGPVQGVVLDWSGTCVDYGCMGPAAVFIEVFKQVDVMITRDVVRRFMGLSKIDHLRALCADASVVSAWQDVYGRLPNEEDIQMLYAKIESSMTAAVAHHAELIPGFRDTLKDLRQRDIKIGTSTGYPGPVMEILTQKALGQGFEPDAVFCASDVPVGRPYPWMCFKNAVALQVYPMEAMVKIGDTIADIHEGLNAGMWTIGLTQSGNEMGLTESEISRLGSEELQQRNYAIARRFNDAGAHYTAAGIWDCLPIIEEINGHLSKGHQPL